MVVGIGAGQVYQQISVQEARNARLGKEIVALDNKLKRQTQNQRQFETLEWRLEVIEGLRQQNRYVALLFNLLSVVTPSGIVMEKVTFKNGKTTLEGYAESNAELAKLVSRLERYQGVENVRIHSIVSQSKSPVVMDNKFVTTFEFIDYVVPSVTLGG